MEKEKLENPSAFPLLDAEMSFRNEGMSLRDYFANYAMLGILNNGLTIKDESFIQQAYESVSKQAYLLADEMLKQRKL